ncbi:MAG TPA: ammonium transporter, partial [Pyrinomonadaceae bacterium]|nr:ammonium transporter [Pyrinomonadaceae bacterium]
LLCSAAAMAQDLSQRIGRLEAASSAAQSNVDNGWVLICSALVLLMTIPGLALFYGGLVRQKNVLSMMLKSLICVGIVTLLWVFVGYSLVFSEGNSVIGGLNFAFLRGVGVDANADYSTTLPQLSFMIFQLMFAIITPALITGAFAERIKFSAKLLFTTLWMLVVYFPLAHMVWGKGGFLNATLGGVVPALDFAGGTVVHISSGVSALVCAVYMGRRIGYANESTPPHNAVLSAIGAGLLWFGWFGFNAGSALSPNGLAANAFVTTHLAAASAMLSWLLIDWLRSGKPTLIGAISGAVAGLVGVTPAAGFVTPMSAIVIGLIAGAGCYVMAIEVKRFFGYDDTLDVFGIHGFGGAVGAILTGVFATVLVNPVFKDVNGSPLPVGLVDGNVEQVLNQIIAVAITAAIASVGTLAALKIVDVLIGLRVTAADEIAGLDISQHGETAYAFTMTAETVHFERVNAGTDEDELADYLAREIMVENEQPAS